MAPMLAKEMLPPLDVNGTAFAERGIVVEKGLVTNSDLAKVYKELWQDSGRRSVVRRLNVPCVAARQPTHRACIHAGGTRDVWLCACVASVSLHLP